jgi:hypothetical protein
MMGFTDDGSYGYSHMASMWRARARVRGFECDLGGYRLRISFTRELMERMKAILSGFQYEARIPSGGLIIAVEDDMYIAVGVNFMLRFLPRDSFSSNVEILWVDEGVYKDGEWIPDRRLNGDETGHGSYVYFDDKPKIRMVKVHSVG